MTLLSAKNLTGGYGNTKIIFNCSIKVDKGQIAVVVGPNGAGKSTAMKAIFGLINLFDGSIYFKGEDITSMPPEKRVISGMAMVPQVKNIFPSLTVQENLEIGAYLRNDDYTDSLNEIFDLFPVLKQKRKQIAGELSGGQRQQLALGRAIITQPKLLLLDEPTAGVSPKVMDDLFKQIIEIRDKGIGILIVEQNARKALEVADIGYVLVNGKNKYTGSGNDLLNNPEVRIAFLGG